MTPLEARKTLALMQAAWPAAPWPPGTVELYRNRLETYERAATIRAVERLVSDLTFRPSIAELQGAVRIAERAIRADFPPIDCRPREVETPVDWLRLAHDVLAGRRHPPSAEQLELWEVAE